MIGEPVTAEPVVCVGLSQVSEEALVAELQRRGGYRIATDDGKGWVTPSQASRACGRNKTWLCKLLRKRRGNPPPGIELDYAVSGKGKRLLRVRLSPEFHAWLEPQPRLPL